MTGSRSPIPTVGAARASERREAERASARAEAEAAGLLAGRASRARAKARRGLSEIETTQAEIEQQVEALEGAAARFAEAAAAASERLVELSAATDFSPPPLPGGLHGAVQKRREEAT